MQIDVNNFEGGKRVLAGDNANDERTRFKMRLVGFDNSYRGIAIIGQAKTGLINLLCPSFHAARLDRAYRT